MNVKRAGGTPTGATILIALATWWTRRSRRQAAPAIPAPRAPRFDDDIYELASPDGAARW